MVAQTTVYSENFSVTSSSEESVAGAIGTSDWSVSRSGSDYGARIFNGNLELTNNATNAANTSGWIRASTSTDDFASPYRNILSENPGNVVWTFNMRQRSLTPNGFESGSHGAAFILAGTSGSSTTSGTGYAVILGNSGSADPVRLVRYSGGLRSYTNIITSNTSGMTDFARQYLSIKVIYTPITNTWQLFVRNDGTSAFQDPSQGTLTFQGSAVNNQSTSTNLDMMGALWNAGWLITYQAFFDNVKVTVAEPTITSIVPPSKVAGTPGFTLTVNGTNFVANGGSIVQWNFQNRPTTFVSSTQVTATIPATDILLPGTASVRIANGFTLSNSQIFTIDAPATPVVTPSTNSLAQLNTVSGTASANASFTLTGANLTGDVTVTMPANFEASTNATTGFAQTLTLPKSATGSLLTQPSTIFVRIRSTATVGVNSGSISVSTPGGATKSIAVTGRVMALQPTIAASALTFTNVSSTSFRVNFTPGNGTSRIVLIKSGSAVNSAPVDGTTYSASSIFANGSELGTANYAVYNSTGNFVTVTGLTPATTYHVAIYEFNGTSLTENYATTPMVGNRATLNPPLGWPIFAANTVNTINFDDTVDGVNDGHFQGVGVSSLGEFGELNSNAFAFTGFSSGNVAFGGNSPEDSDYDRGSAENNVSESGLYAFEISPDNQALGIQSATGNFAPGTVTLRFQNRTAAPITSINVGYSVAIFNDQPSAANFNFSHSANTTSFTAIPEVDVVSGASADVVPEWKTRNRAATITGLNIPVSGYYYLRWSTNGVSGSGEFDEFALDNISLVANPSTQFVTFSGSAEEMVLQGNASLSDNLTITNQLTFGGGKLVINGKTLNIGGNITNQSVGGIRGDAAAHVVVSSPLNIGLSFDQSNIGTTNLVNELRIASNSSNIIQLLSPIQINETLSIFSGQTLDLMTNTIGGALPTINVNGTILTQRPLGGLPSGKTWNGDGLIHYNSTSAIQTVAPGTYNNLTLSSPLGSVASANFTVNGILNLPTANPSATKGSLSMETFSLLMGADATNVGIGDVTGITTRNTVIANHKYTFGNPHTSIVFAALGTLPTSMSLKVNIGEAPAWRPGAIKRHFDFIHTGGLNTRSYIKAHYLDSELNGNNENRLVDWANITATNSIVEQGRSNFNTQQNWVELNNVNLSVYFEPTFGKVLLTLDEMEASLVTWNGSVSDSWTTAENWTPNATPSDDTLVIIPDAATTLHDPTINPLTRIGEITIEAGGIVNTIENSQLTITGGAGAWLNFGTYNALEGNRVIFTSNQATIAGNTTFHHITVAENASLRTMTNNVMRIAGDFVNNGIFSAGGANNTVNYIGTNQNVVLPLSGNDSYVNLTITGSGAILPPLLTIKGHLTTNTVVDFSGNTIIMDGNERQRIRGSVPAIFNNLVLNNIADFQLENDISVLGTLTMNDGNLFIRNRNLTLGQNPVVGNFSATTMIVADETGMVGRNYQAPGSYLFPIGENASNPGYSPINVEITSGTFNNGFVSVSLTDAIHPNNSSLHQHLTRYWNVTQTGISDAVANVTASFLNFDIVGSANEIAAAQLNGIFDQQSNPWIKFGPIGANSLTVTAAQIPEGQFSSFTGVKAQNLTVDIAGYGEFCMGADILLEALISGGDAPFTYSWTADLSSTSKAVVPSTTSGTTIYQVTVKDANGFTATNSVEITVFELPVGGTIAANQVVCSGTLAADLILQNYTGTILHWESSLSPTFETINIIEESTDVLAATEIGLLTETTYFRAKIGSGTCDAVYSNIAQITVSSTTWNGTEWSNGQPAAGVGVVFTGNFTATTSFTACSITVQNGAVVTIPSGNTVTLAGAIDVQSGNFILENNANLIQTSEVENSGNISVKRVSSPLFRLDYTMWSSPVSGTQTLKNFSPATTDNRFYILNTLTNTFNDVDPLTTTFETTRGYLIRVRNTHVAAGSSAPPQTWQGTFTGVPNNGTKTFGTQTGGLRYNMIGNPYPSTIDANLFLAANQENIDGTLYFWRRLNSAPVDGEAHSAYYATYTIAGGTEVNPDPEAPNDENKPNGIIQSGQGFVVIAKPAAENIVFNNLMRTPDHQGQFFRQGQSDRSRLWLNVRNSNGLFGQMLVAYMGSATNGIDRADGKYFNDGTFALTSLIEGGEYIIQGRAPFVESDVVTLGFKSPTAGLYNIELDQVDGLFAGNQNIYLKDKFTNVTHDLKSGSYSFSSDAGNFTDRFEIVYLQQPELSTPDQIKKSVTVYSSQSDMIVDGGQNTLSTVAVYDIRGRFLMGSTDINKTQIAFANVSQEQVLIVKITLQDGMVINKKYINKK